MTLWSKSLVVPCKKMVSFGQLVFRKGFNSSKCKTLARLAMSRIKLLRNKRDIQLKQMRRDVAMLIQSGQEASARIRVEHVIREQNIMAANEIIELFCELVVVRLPIIVLGRECPADLKEGISSLIFAAPRCADIPELLQIRHLFEKKYGKEFVAAATELRPDCGVNRTLVEKLSVRTPTGEVKLKIMKEIAKEYQLEWDTSESKKELLKPPEDLLEGPCTFVSATSIPTKPAFVGDTTMPPNGQHSNNRSFDPRSSFNNNEMKDARFENTAAAAEAAAEAAKKAVTAAQAAAFLANHNSHQVGAGFGFSPKATRSEEAKVLGNVDLHGSISKSQNFDKSRYMNNDGMDMVRRHSYNVPPPTFANARNSEIYFANSDGMDTDGDSGEEMVMDPPHSLDHGRHGGAPSFPPNRPPPPLPPTAGDFGLSGRQNPVSNVHPKLPDYDALTARFEALKNQRS